MDKGMKILLGQVNTPEYLHPFGTTGVQTGARHSLSGCARACHARQSATRITMCWELVALLQRLHG